MTIDEMLAACVTDATNTQNALDYAHYYSTQVGSVLSTDIAVNQQLIDIMTLLTEMVSRFDGNSPST
jgi:hypothetical protein